jgi:hypothetical protein
MYVISSDDLSAHVLDPVADRDRMGPRYCTGGYVFQVEDASGPLLSGPTYPESFNWFDGQGIPDSFFRAPLYDPKEPGPQALVPGIGVCDLAARTVLEHCDWTVLERSDHIEFRTVQRWSEYAFELEREVTVAGRVVRSETRVTNTGKPQVPIRWFPHPFYPLPAGPDSDGAPLCSLPGPVTVPRRTTYSVGPDGYLRCSDFSALQAVGVRCDERGPLAVFQRHPTLGLVSARYSFPAGHVLVWGNPNTFSFEPYLEQTVGAGDTLEWSAEYHF